MHKRTPATFNGKDIYVSPNNRTAKIGPKGTPQPIKTILAAVGKGNARKIRRWLRANGFTGLATEISTPS